MSPPFPYRVPAEVYRKLISDCQVSFVAAKIDVEFGCDSIIMISIKSYADQIAIAVVIPIADEGIHLLRMLIFTINTDVNVFIIIEYLHPGPGICMNSFKRNDLREFF